MHQDDELQNTIDIDRTVGAISLGPQYNLQVGYFIESLITVNASGGHIGPLLTLLRISMNNTTRLTPKVVQKTSFLVILMINPSHPPTLISQINMTTMALKLTLP